MPSDASRSLLGGYDGCSVDDEHDLDAHSHESSPSDNTPTSTGPPDASSAVRRASDEDSDASDRSYSDANDAPSHDDGRGGTTDDDRTTLLYALRSMHSDTDRTIWLIRKSDGSVGYVRKTDDVQDFFEQWIDDAQRQYGWESTIQTEWHWTNQSGLKVEVVRSTLTRTFPLSQPVHILDTFHVSPCNPIGVDLR